MSESFRADLHCHSSCSDGELTPKQLIDLAVASGLQGLSITDHDTIGAYPEALPLAEKSGVQLLPGVELSTLEAGHSVHILAYGFDPQNSEIQKLCQEQMLRRQGRVRRILDRLREQRMEVEVSIQGAVGRPHVAAAMVQAGYISSIPEAFRKYLGEGKSAYVPTDAVSSEEAIDRIHQAGALAVLAHPVLIRRNRLLRQLLDRPFDGLEAYYARVAAAEKTRFVKIASSKGWLATGGSDFHGPSTRYGNLGTSWTPKETFENLYAHYLKNLCAN